MRLTTPCGHVHGVNLKSPYIKKLIKKPRTTDRIGPTNGPKNRIKYFKIILTWWSLLQFRPNNARCMLKYLSIARYDIIAAALQKVICAGTGQVRVSDGLLYYLEKLTNNWNRICSTESRYNKCS